MDIGSKTTHWNKEQVQRLYRERAYAVETITELPFMGNDQQAHSVQRGQIQQHKLCNACTQIISVISKLLAEAVAAGRMRPQTIAMDYTLLEIHKSAKLGCHLCSILEASSWRYVKGGKVSALELDEEKLEDSWCHLNTRPSGMEEVVCTLGMEYVNTEKIAQASQELNFFPSKDFDRRRPQDETSPLDQISWSTGHQSTFDIVAGLLKKCRETHGSCKPLRSPEPNVPRRLLQLGETSVRVVDNTMQLQYACLSHCWGSQANVPHKLTSGAQYEAFKISSLPKTFQDAIEITKRLGLEYIWIDCFCIVQGSRDDWIEQSAVMAQIYANSVFTIAALAAPNTHAGCFQERNPLAIQPLRTNTLAVEPRLKDLLWRLEIEGSATGYSPLHTRAWVVQERLSATRTIYYGACGVYWECRCMRASENHVKGVEDVTENTKTLLNKLQAAAEGTGDADLSQTDNKFLDRWRRLLEVYTICSLTYFSDKLIAISGVTRDIERYSGKQFLQGLWRNDISTGLLWSCRFPLNGFTKVDYHRVADSGFPSWSWASMLGMILYFDPQRSVIWRPQISVVEGSQDKCLRLTSWRRKVSLHEYGDLVLTDDGSCRGDLDEWYTWYPDERVPSPAPMEIVLVQRILTPGESFIRVAKCVVIKRVEGNTYTRVGMVNIRFYSPRDDPFPGGDPPDRQHEILLV